MSSSPHEVLIRRRLAGFTVKHLKRHYVVRRPLELFSFRLWPLLLAGMWGVMFYTGGVLQQGDILAKILNAMAFVTCLMHAAWPLRTPVRYTALYVNLIAMIWRAWGFLAFIPSLHLKVKLTGVALWLTLAGAKICMFMVTTALVRYEMALAKKGVDGNCNERSTE